MTTTGRRTTPTEEPDVWEESVDDGEEGEEGNFGGEGDNELEEDNAD